MAAQLVVFAAGSLRTPFRVLADAFEEAGEPSVQLRFDNAQALRLAMEAGAHADVFASASRADPDRLVAAGLLEAVEAFASNTVVLAVPSAGSSVGSVADAGRLGVRLAVEVAGVPLGDYTREAISQLARKGGFGDLLGNIVSEDEDVVTVAGRVLRGEADAAFLYRSDVVTSGGRLAALDLPEVAHIAAEYVVAVARGTHQREAAGRWLELLRSARGQGALRDAGFGRPL